MNENDTRTYVAQDSFILRAGKEVAVGEELELTLAQARPLLHYGRIAPKPDAEAEGGIESEDRDPEPESRDPGRRRRR